MRAAVRGSLVVTGLLMVVSAIVSFVGAIVDGGSATVAVSTLSSLSLGCVGGVVARAGIRNDEDLPAYERRRAESIR